MPDPSLLVLSSLTDGDKHGYAMMEDIERFSGFRLGPGTLYGAITRLEQRGWIRQVASGDRRQPYTLTSAGREYLKDQLENLDEEMKRGIRLAPMPPGSKNAGAFFVRFVYSDRLIAQKVTDELVARVLQESLGNSSATLSVLDHASFRRILACHPSPTFWFSASSSP